MGPPTYGRSLSSRDPYPRPGSVASERKASKDGRRESRGGETGLLLLPDFSDLTNTFEVEIFRNSLGLGFSISGGPDAASPWTNLIRVKKIFPLQPAWETSKLRVGDIILRVSGIPLTGLHLRQALDILRTSPPTTLLQVCRVSDSSGNSWASLQPPRSRASIVRSYSYGTPCPPCHQYSPEPENRPPLSLCSTDSMDIEISPPSPSPPSSREWSPDEDSSMSLLQPVEDAIRNSRTAVGQFTIKLTKVSGSLGFTLRQLDDTVLKHTIKALVKEPAISDGRLQPGDKLLAANGVELATFSHQEVIQFLRQCPETVSLELYRDASRSQTPLSPEQSLFDTIVTRSLSQDSRRNNKPSLSNVRTSQSPSRKLLRYEAAELVRSLQSSRTSLEKAGLGGSSNPGSYSSGGTLGRRLGRPFSPALRRKEDLCSPQPTIESPLSPHNSSAPASLSQGVTRAFQGLHLQDQEQERGLYIEEVESGHASPCGLQVQGVVSAPHSPSGGGEPLVSSRSLPLPSEQEEYLIAPDTEYHKPERPNDLSFSNQSRRQGFVFNNNWNLNKNKF